ncbi:hypothetical protein B0H34DRAFT_670819 [Crassisporium funariophilum]|nr:hypothetical protein B0H34DRAFT_670819 [Crassisporium funariophilum]
MAPLVNAEPPAASWMGYPKLIFRSNPVNATLLDLLPKLVARATATASTTSTTTTTTPTSSPTPLSYPNEPAPPSASISTNGLHRHTLQARPFAHLSIFAYIAFGFVVLVVLAILSYLVYSCYHSAEMLGDARRWKRMPVEKGTWAGPGAGAGGKGAEVFDEKAGVGKKEAEADAEGDEGDSLEGDESMGAEKNGGGGLEREGGVEVIEPKDAVVPVPARRGLSIIGRGGPTKLKGLGFYIRKKSAELQNSQRKSMLARNTSQTSTPDSDSYPPTQSSSPSNSLETVPAPSITSPPVAHISAQSATYIGAFHLSHPPDTPPSPDPSDSQGNADARYRKATVTPPSPSPLKFRANDLTFFPSPPKSGSGAASPKGNGASNGLLSAQRQSPVRDNHGRSTIALAEYDASGVLAGEQEASIPTSNSARARAEMLWNDPKLSPVQDAFIRIPPAMPTSPPTINMTASTLATPPKRARSRRAGADTPSSSPLCTPNADRRAHGRRRAKAAAERFGGLVDGGGEGGEGTKIPRPVFVKKEEGGNRAGF